MIYSSDFLDDMTNDLDKIERGYVRKPVTIILSFVTFFIVGVLALADGLAETAKVMKDCWWKEFVVLCWEGPDVSHIRPITEMDLPQVDKALEIIDDQEERLYQQKRQLTATKKYLTEKHLNERSVDS